MGSLKKISKCHWIADNGYICSSEDTNELHDAIKDICNLLTVSELREISCVLPKVYVFPTCQSHFVSFLFTPPPQTYSRSMQGEPYDIEHTCHLIWDSLGMKFLVSNIISKMLINLQQQHFNFIFGCCCTHVIAICNFLFRLKVWNLFYLLTKGYS